MWDGDLWVRDPAGANLAMFLSFPDGRVRGWPTTGLFEHYRSNMGTPLWVPPGIWYLPEGFLSFLARLASVDNGMGAHLTASSSRDGRFTDVALTRHMDARRIAELTGFDEVMVRDVLVNHLTITPEHGPAEAQPDG